jgi:hypothetical protein
VSLLTELRHRRLQLIAAGLELSNDDSAWLDHPAATIQQEGRLRRALDEVEAELRDFEGLAGLAAADAQAGEVLRSFPAPPRAQPRPARPQASITVARAGRGMIGGLDEATARRRGLYTLGEAQHLCDLQNDPDCDGGGWAPFPVEGGWYRLGGGPI